MQTPPAAPTRSAASLLAVTILTLSLGGCATEHSEPLALITVATPAPRQGDAARPGCPVLTEYDAAKRDRIAAALARLSPDDPLRGVVADYGNLRDQTRACRR